MERFLAAFDGSAAAREALRAAILLAQRAGGHVDVVVVSAADASASAGPLGIGSDALDAVGAASCAHEASRMLATHAASSAVHVVHGTPAGVVVDVAIERASDLIFAGHHGRGALLDVVLGSTTKSIIAQAACPVLVTGEQGPSSLGPILAALDGSPEATAACDAAAALARRLGARLALLHVVETARLGAATRALTVGEFRGAAERNGVRILAAAARRCAAAGVAATVHQVRGDPAAQILRAAGDHGAQLIAIGRSPRSGLERLTFGSVVDAILYRSRAAVLVATGTPAPRPAEPSAAAAAP